MDIARPRCRGGKASRRMAILMGCKPPPPRPWIIRKKTRWERPVAVPHRRELMVKMTMEIRRYFLRPMSLASQALKGITTALATR